MSDRQRGEWESVRKAPSIYRRSSNLSDVVESAKRDASVERLDARNRFSGAKIRTIRVDVKRHPDGGYYAIQRSRSGKKFDRLAPPDQNTVAVVTLDRRGCMRTRQIEWAEGKDVNADEGWYRGDECK